MPSGEKGVNDCCDWSFGGMCTSVHLGLGVAAVTILIFVAVSNKVMQGQTHASLSFVASNCTADAAVSR